MTPEIEISALIKPVIDGFKRANEELNNLFKIGLTDYLHSQTEKYYFTNTFLHRSEKVRFKDIYFPIKASYKELTTDFTKIDEVFENYKNITLVGSAGSGKTTLLKHIFLKTIQNKNRIPILIELRNLNDYEGSFEKIIADKVLMSRVKPSDLIFKRALASGDFLFLLDGYDEIFSTNKQEINRQIESFVDANSKNRFLITTRPGSGIEGFPRFYDFKVNSLADEDVVGFITKMVDDSDRRNRIVKIVNDPKNSGYFEFLRNPLLLSMFIMAFENHPEIPKRKSAFYRNVFDTLYSKHDGITKNSWPREKLTKLQRDDFENILCVFSYLTLIEGQYSFTEEYLSDSFLKVKKHSDYDFIVQDLIYDLQTSISILILDGFEYYFPHRSLQEYFTALFISKLPTEKKHKAYEKLATALEESSTDYSFTFWNLCLELDETVFVSNFLLPELKKISAKLENKHGKELLIAYLNIIEANFFVGDFENNGQIELRIFKHSNLQNAVLDFCDMYNYKELWKFPKSSGYHDDFLKLHTEVGQSKRGTPQKFNSISDNPEIIKLLITHNVLAIINDYKEKISNKISEWENNIKRRKDHIDDLLG